MVVLSWLIEARHRSPQLSGHGCRSSLRCGRRQTLISSFETSRIAPRRFSLRQTETRFAVGSRGTLYSKSSHRRTFFVTTVTL